MTASRVGFGRRTWRRMYTTGIGLVMSVTAAVMMVFGALWLKQTVKVEV